MVDHYVDSGASGANNGTSKTDAWTTLDASDAASTSAGDNIFVSHTHSASQSGNITLVWADNNPFNPLKIISTNFSDDSLTVGASETTTTNFDDFTLNGCFWMYGLSFDPHEEMIFGDSVNATRLILESCSFLHTSSDADRGIRFFSTDNTDQQGNILTFQNCTFDPEANTIQFGFRGYAEFLGCTFNTEAETGFDFNSRGVGGTRVIFRSCDLIGSGSAPTTWLVYDNSSTNNGPKKFHFRNCQTPYDAGSITTSNEDNSFGTEILVENSELGTITDPALGMSYKENRWGQARADLSVYRTGGATDGEQANAYSWRVVTSSNCLEATRCFELPPLSRWVDGGSAITATIYFASGATQNDDDIWIEWHNPDTAGSATAQNNFTSSRISDVMGTPSAHTTDGSSTWNGTGVGTKQQDSITFTPTNAGWLFARIFVAKPSTTLFIDPQIVLS